MAARLNVHYLSHISHSGANTDSGVSGNKVIKNQPIFARIFCWVFTCFTFLISAFLAEYGPAVNRHTLTKLYLDMPTLCVAVM